MYKSSILIILVLIALATAKVNVGFYSLSQTTGDFQNKWIGYALADIISEKLENVSELNVIKDDQIYDYLSSKGANTFLNTSNKASFEGDIKDNFKLDYLVTGDFRVNPDNSLPITVNIFNLKDSVVIAPIVIQGFANDLYTIVSYITHPLCINMGVNPSMDEMQKIKQIDLTAKRTGISSIYKGKISFRNKDYKGATDFFEEAYKEDPSNSVAKTNYDKALAYFYGEGIFALNLLETDFTINSPFRKQYMTTRKISKSYSAELLSSNLSPRNGGTHFDVDMALRLTLAPDAYYMTTELIKKFSSTGSGDDALSDGVYNPNANKVIGEREIFETNVGNFIIVIKFLDKDGKVLQQSAQTFKSSFGMTYPGAVKDKVFKNSFADASIYMSSVSRDIVRNTTKVLITVE
jgi:tetratricopeptide (TPR) repeat protein